MKTKPTKINKEILVNEQVNDILGAILEISLVLHQALKDGWQPSDIAIIITALFENQDALGKIQDLDLAIKEDYPGTANAVYYQVSDFLGELTSPGIATAAQKEITKILNSAEE